MLYELFSWMCNSEQPLPFSQAIVSRIDCEAESQLAIKQRRMLIADLRNKRYGEQPASGSSEEQQKVTHYEEYVQFLEFCRQDLCLHENENLHFLVLKYCVSLKAKGDETDKTAATTTKLFISLLNENKERTLALYKQHQQVFEKLEQVNFAVDLVIATDKTVAYLSQLTSQLRGEKNPLTIAPLFFKFVDETERYGAAILWLLQRIDVFQLLQIGLLQNIMSYHLAYLTIQHGPLELFYQLLSQFPEAKALLEAAGSKQCEERGFDSFSLTGTRKEKASLSRVEILLPSPVLTPDEDNFNALYQLFGLNYLKLAIEGYAKYNEEKWGRILRDFLNRDSEQLSVVINLIVTSSPGMLEVLASLIDDSVIETLAKRHNGAIFHFLPYKPALLLRLMNSDVKFYLMQLCAGDAPAFEKMSQLLVLFDAFRNGNKRGAILAYESILDLVLENRGFLDDYALLKALRKFAEKDKIIEKKSRALHAQFNLCVEQQMLVRSLCIASYHAMEDTWTDVSRKLAALNLIKPINRSCPLSKYKFQVFVAREFYSNYPNEFNLDDFFQAVEIPAAIMVDKVNTYERLLIELVTAIDDERLRGTIIEKLVSFEATRQRWMHTEYDGENVVKKAIKQDNVGLITWLDANADLDDLESTIIEAAETGSWKVVNYVCHYRKLSQRTFKAILVLAAESGQDELVKFLCRDSIVNLLRKDVIETFMQAASNQHTEVMRFLLSNNPEIINETMIVNLFKTAAQLQRLTSLVFLGNLMESRLLLRAVEVALKHAVVHDRFVVIQQLCGLQANAPRLAIIEKSFLGALENGNLTLARYFCKLPDYVFDQSVIDKALKTAVTTRSMHAIAFVFDLKIYYPSQFAIEQALMKLVKVNRTDCVRFLCGLTRNTPREQAIEQALFLAIKHNAYACVVYLSGRVVNPQVIPKAIQWAAQFGTLKILQFCCKIHPPERREVQAALHKASSQHHGKVSGYLRGILSFVTSSCPDLLGLQGLSRPRSMVMGPARHASTSSIHQCGFFGDKAETRRHLSESDYSDDAVPTA